VLFAGIFDTEITSSQIVYDPPHTESGVFSGQVVRGRKRKCGERRVEKDVCGERRVEKDP
jgi:hypothetical protein